MPSPPDLRRLRLDRNAPRLPELSAELWLSILTAVDSESPCDEVADACSFRKDLAAWCRDGTVYDLANKKLGWYGEHNTWQDLVTKFLQNTRRGRVWHREHGNNMTPKTYFQRVCRDRREIVKLCVQCEDLYYDISKGTLSPDDQARAFNASEDADLALRTLLLAHVCGADQAATPYASELFKFAVAIDGKLLQHVPGSVRPGPAPTTRANPMPAAIRGYHDIAKLAVQQNGWALAYVHPSRDDFGELARFAVQGFPLALRFVPGSDWYRRSAPTIPPRGDFGEIGGIALRSGKGTFSYRALNEVRVRSPHYLSLLMARREIFRGRDGNRASKKDPSEGWWDIHGQGDGHPRLTFPEWAPKTKFALQAESVARITEIINTTPTMAVSAECLAHNASA